MKKSVFILALLMSFVVISCQKNDRKPIQSESAEGYWKTPDGYIIPYSERGNWKNFVKENFSMKK